MKLSRKTKFTAVTAAVAVAAVFTPVGLVWILIEKALMNKIVGDKSPFFYDCTKMTDFGCGYTIPGHLVFWTGYLVPFVIVSVILYRSGGKP